MAGSGSIGIKQYNKTAGTITIPGSRPPAKYNGPGIKKEKKMGWFRKKFNNWVRAAWEEARAEPVDTYDTYAITNSISGKSSVRFTIYAASGGYVIEHYKQDRYKENDGPELTVVQNGDSLGQTVEHILTMEALKS
jgi:hypothetical protein